MTNFKKRICIIGAGVCGITSAKACLEENFEPVVFDKTNYIAGLWRYQDGVAEDGVASVMRSTIINTSKEMTAFSDFPPPADFSNYMHNSKMAEYLENYADSFGFRKYLNSQTQILKVEYADDYEKTGRWKVTYEHLESKERKSDIFDGVLICTGHHNFKNVPKFPGQEKFKGKIMHTHHLKHAQGFENKTVVIIGIGNSGGDAAIELSTVTKQLYLSTRRGTWVARRVGENGLPFDISFHRRYLKYILQFIPYDLRCQIVQSRLNRVMDHDAFQLRPNHGFFSQHIMINDALPNRILSGRVEIKPDIDHFTEDGVVFKGEKDETKCDVVILATGYNIKYPFISTDILPVKDNSVRLYKFSFVPGLKHPHTLAVIGLIQPIGCIFQIAELQARWYAQLMAGNVKLPSENDMNADIDFKLENMRKRYYGSTRHTIQVDWIPFLDELAELVGVKPPIWKYFFTDFPLFKTLMFEPAAAYQYRLVGPHAWEGAREAQMTVNQRILAPLNTNKMYSQRRKLMKKDFNVNSFFGKLFIISLIIMAIVYKFLF